MKKIEYDQIRTLKVMTKIQVRVVLLDEGVFLVHLETKLVFQYAAPHKLVGKIDIERYKLIRCGRKTIV